ncbi:dynactin p62 family-domain-containing protein [Gaertneriomyces semiglobifer]|nr:dynactin p62 family-domain-containing protein [Gaertneriomyces semiglobifer]
MQPEQPVTKSLVGMVTADPLGYWFHTTPKFVAIPPPFVQYQCHCRDHITEPELETPDRQLYPPNAGDFLDLFPISRMYFCDHCRRICCPCCTKEEVACYFCPNCLFEVPSASVKAEKNRCGRNCFECPVCENTLQVVSAVEASTSASDVGEFEGRRSSVGNLHYLSCGACQWTSMEIGLQFERPTGLATQLQKSEDAKDDVREFENLRRHFEKVTKVKDTKAGTLSLLRSSAATAMGLPASLLASIPALASFASLSSRTPLGGADNQDSRLEAYSPLFQPPETGEPTVGLADPVNSTTLRQKLNQPCSNPLTTSALYPQRIKLRTKRARRCRRCEHILVKPEQKAQSTRFKIKLMAAHFIPTITISSVSPMAAERTCQVILTFTNPTDTLMDVSLATTHAASRGSDIESDQSVTVGNCEVALVAPKFTIDPLKELWEYEDDQEIIGTQQRIVGIQEKRKNYVKVLLTVTPKPSLTDDAAPMQASDFLILGNKQH